MCVWAWSPLWVCFSGRSTFRSSQWADGLSDRAQHRARPSGSSLVHIRLQKRKKSGHTLLIPFPPTSLLHLTKFFFPFLLSGFHPYQLSHSILLLHLLLQLFEALLHALVERSKVICHPFSMQTDSSAQQRDLNQSNGSLNRLTICPNQTWLDKFSSVM